MSRKRLVAGVAAFLLWNAASLAVEYNVTVLAPDGGETLAIGEMYDITWETDCSGFDARIYLSVDGGVTWPHVIKFSSASDTPLYSWKVGYKNTEQDPTLPPVWEQVVSSTESQCLIRIEDYNDSTIVDESDAVFTIEPGGGDDKPCGGGAGAFALLLLLAAARRRR